MFPQVLKNRKSYLEQFRKRQSMARLLNDPSLDEVLLPPIQKLNLKSGHAKKSRPRSRSRSTSRSSQKQGSADTVSNPKAKSEDITRRAGDGYHEAADERKGAKEKRDKDKTMSVMPNEKKTKDRKEREDDYSNKTKRSSFNETLTDHSKDLDLTEYEKECLGFYEKKWATGFSEEEDFNKLLDSCSGRLEEEYLDAVQRPPLSPPDNFYDDLDLDSRVNWQQDIITSEEESMNKKNDTGTDTSSLAKIVNMLSLRKWMSTAADENNNTERNKPPPPQPQEKSGPWQMPEEEREHQQNNDRFDPSSEPTPHMLLSAAISSLLSEFNCGGMHIEGDPNCFECRHKDAFKSLTENYLEELMYIEENREMFSEATKDAKIVEILQVWIYQLSEQNLQLGRAYNESMQSSEKLRSFLTQSRNSLKSQQWQHDIDRSKIDALNYEISLREQSINKLKSKMEMEGEEVKEIREELQQAKADVDSLTKLVVRLRDKGVWDIHGLPMSDKTFKKIFSGDYYLHGAKVIGQKEFSEKKREWRSEIEQLRTEADTLRAIIASRDREIQKFKSQGVGTYNSRCKRHDDQ